MINQRILNSIGRQNYETYILLTGGKEINKILNSNNSVFEMYNYRHKLINKNVGQDIEVEFTTDNLKEDLEKIFLEHLNESQFKIVKDILLNHIGEWTIDRLLEIHRQYKYYRIFRLLNTNYKNWLN